MSQPDWPSLPAAELAASLTDKDAFIRRAALAELCRRGPSPEAQRALLAGFADASGYVKRTASDIATGWQYRPAHDLVMGLLGDAEDRTRVEALRALCTLGVEADIPSLLPIYDSDPSEDARRMAAWALQLAATPASWEPIFARLERDALGRHRVWACELASRFGNATHLPALERLTGDDDGHVRTAASRAVAALAARVSSTA